MGLLFLRPLLFINVSNLAIVLKAHLSTKTMNALVLESFSDFTQYYKRPPFWNRCSSLTLKIPFKRSHSFQFPLINLRAPHPNMTLIYPTFTIQIRQC